MTDRKDDYYQPWTQAPDGGRSDMESSAGQGLPKPRDLPPVGLDLSRYAEEEDKGPRAPLIDGDKLKENSAKLAQSLRQGASKFAAWTIAMGQKADIPKRVEALELPRRTKQLAKKTGTVAASAAQSAASATKNAAQLTAAATKTAANSAAAATKSAANSTAKASKVGAEKSAEAWQKMALGDKVTKLGSGAVHGLSEIADKTKTGIGSVAKAGKDSLGETAGKLLPPKAEEEAVPTPPPSGLEALLEREAEAARNKPSVVKGAEDLPLFSAEDEKKVVLAEPSSPAGDVPAPVEKVAAVEAAPATPASVAPPPEPAVVEKAFVDTPVVTPAPAAAPTAPVAGEPVAPVAPAPAPQPAPHIAPAPAPAAKAADAPLYRAQPAAPKTDGKSVPNYEVVNNAAPTMAAYAPQRAAAWQPSGKTLGLAGVALAALMGTSFYLGSQFGGGLSQADVETIVADYITTNPQVIPAALEMQRGREIAKAIDAVRPALEKPYAGAWGGNADGDVTLVVFTDYACGFCRASVPDIDRLIREDKRLKVVYRELPIISRESRAAALMALLAARQGKYDAFHHAMFAQSSLAPSAIIAAAEKAGVTLDTGTDSEAEEAVFQRELESNLALATELQLNATPTWVIGDQLMQGQVGYAALQDAVAKARAKKAG